MGLRLTIISPGYPPLRGGVADYAARLADALVDAECNVTVITTRGLRHPSANPGVDVKDAIPAWSFRYLWRLLRTVQTARPDAVLFQDAKEQPSNPYLLMVLPLLVRWLVRRPTVMIIHEIEGRRQRLQAKLLGRVVVVESEFRATFTPGPQVNIVPIGSNLPRPPTLGDARTVRLHAGVGQGELAIGFFGFPAAHKGLDVLCDAIAAINAGGRPARLVLIGDAASAFDSCITRCPCGAIGGIGLDAVAAAVALDSMDVNALPFRTGARSRYGSLLAALECATPIVTTPGFGRKVLGLVECRPGDSSDLARAILDAATLPRCPDRRAVPAWDDVARDFLYLLALPSEHR